MFYGSNETQELRTLYNFGGQDSATNRPNDSVNTDQQVPLPIREGNTESGNEEFSPQNSDVHTEPNSPGVFQGTGVAAQSSTGNTEAPRLDKKKNAKLSVMKEVLGMNKKSTKGMNAEEKAAVNLEQRWKNALAEEGRLNQLEQRVVAEEATTATLGNLPNFPPKFLCIKPLVYHSFSAVPEHRRFFVRMAFFDWVAVSILLAVNLGVTIGVTYAPEKDGVIIVKDMNKSLNDVLAIVYLVGIPLSFLLWYWRIFKACLTGFPTQHLLAFFGLIIALAQSIFAFVGPLSYGFSGIELARWISATRETGVVAPVAIVTALWGLQACFTCFLIVKQFVLYRKDLAARRAAKRHAVPIVG